MYRKWQGLTGSSKSREFPMSWSRRGALAAVIAGMLLASSCAALEGDGDGEAGGDPDISTDSSAQETEPAAADQSDSTIASEVVSDGETVEETSTTQTTIAPDIQMPDLIGKTEAQARAELSELGLGEPLVETKESFERAGEVLDQLPSPGSTVTGAVNLVVAESIAPMPDFVGLKVAEVRAWAGPREIELRTESILTEEVPAGAVVEQIPSPGAQVSQEIIVKVAEAPVFLDLVELGALSVNRAEVDETQMNGLLYGRTMRLYTRYADPWVTYNLSRDWSTLTIDLGLDDELSSQAVVQVEIKGDDEVLYSGTIEFGMIDSVKIDVTNVLRLSIQAAQIGGGGHTSVGLGNGRLTGGASVGG